jgi:hypothetical protein
MGRFMDNGQWVIAQGKNIQKLISLSAGPAFHRRCKLSSYNSDIQNSKERKMQVGFVPFHGIPSIGYAISASRGGKMSLPVAPSAYIYSHFKHVSGVPASGDARGVSITKLKILDTLIEQLGRMKKQSAPLIGAQGEGADQGSADKRIDALIEQYQSQIRSAQAAAMPFNAGAAPAAGAVFNISA